MSKLPKYLPLQWVAVGDTQEFGQITSGKFYGEGWGYTVSFGKGSERDVTEKDITAYVEDGKWESAVSPTSSSQVHKTSQRINLM